jgi:hypothetical protein
MHGHWDIKESDMKPRLSSLLRSETIRDLYCTPLKLDTSFR